MRYILKNTWCLYPLSIMNVYNAVILDPSVLGILAITYRKLKDQRWSQAQSLFIFWMIIESLYYVHAIICKFIYSVFVLFLIWNRRCSMRFNLLCLIQPLTIMFIFCMTIRIEVLRIEEKKRDKSSVLIDWLFYNFKIDRIARF